MRVKLLSGQPLGGIMLPRGVEIRVEILDDLYYRIKEVYDFDICAIDLVRACFIIPKTRCEEVYQLRWATCFDEVVNNVVDNRIGINDKIDEQVFKRRLRDW